MVIYHRVYTTSQLDKNVPEEIAEWIVREPFDIIYILMVTPQNFISKNSLGSFMMWEDTKYQTHSLTFYLSYKVVLYLLLYLYDDLLIDKAFILMLKRIFRTKRHILKKGNEEI